MYKDKPVRSAALIYVLSIAVLTNAFIGVLLYLIDTYIIFSILKVALVFINIYFLYYILLDLTLTYQWDKEQINIKAIFGLKNIKILYNDIIGYNIESGKIHGITLSGIGNDRFSYGRSIIDKIGAAHMFVSSNKKVIYIKTKDISYAISPKNIEEIEENLKARGISDDIEEFKANIHIELYKDKKFYVPFLLISVLIIILTLNPFIFHWNHWLPERMPLSFDTSFYPIKYGTGRQFAFKQMSYGVANMIILVCMYYASYFCAKYDKKAAYRYIYISLFVVLIFIFLQVRILVTFA